MKFQQQIQKKMKATLQIKKTNEYIAFRVWHEQSNEMIYQGDPDVETLQSFIFHWGDKSLMQWTGLMDDNGTKIFEDDIVEYTQHHFNTTMTKIKSKVVKRLCDRWNVYTTNAGETNITVIGNIYQNTFIE